MKALVVLPQVPSPEGGAAGRCSLALLRGLADNGIGVHALAARQHFDLSSGAPASAGSPGPRSALGPLGPIGALGAFGPLGALGVEVVDVAAPGRSLGDRIANLQAPLATLGRGHFAARVRELAAGADVVHLEQVETAPCDPGRRPAALHLHYRVLLDRAVGNPLQRSHRRTLEFARAERRALRNRRWLIASSPRVADTLRRDRPSAEVVVAPLSLLPERYPQSSGPEQPTAGVIGTAAWPPTAGAIDRLLHRVWPLVRADVPDARVLVAGRGTTELAGAGTLPAGAVVLGAVDSAVDFLSGLSVLAYPLERGSGMKVKVLEALALGVPVVTTPEGAEGIATNDGVVVATADADLARAVASILRDPAERAARGAAARRCFADHYRPAVATAPLVGLYERMVESA